MPHFVWSSEYELGISVIDSQHKRIIDYINSTYDVIDRGANVEEISDILLQLVDYTFSHLAFEEALLEEIGYQDFDGHQLAHRTFSKLIDNLCKRAAKGEDIGAELASFLQNWLITHIMQEDAKYVDAVNTYLAQNGANRGQTWLHRAVTKYFQ